MDACGDGILTRNKFILWTDKASNVVSIQSSVLVIILNLFLDSVRGRKYR